MVDNYYNIAFPSEHVDLRQAVLRGLGAQRGLFMPLIIPKMPDNFFATLSAKSFVDIANELATTLFNADIPKKDVSTIINRAFTFEPVLRPLDATSSILELFHGPTFAFKDFGARFLASLLCYFARGEDREITVLVATSGDTGSAVAQSFAGQEGVKVVILYPSGRVSPLQEQQLTTVGGNVSALEVEGSFDDCQTMVKDAFADSEISTRVTLTSANSINLARLLPQSFYYCYGWSRLADRSKAISVVVPSGNFGNLTAAVIAKRMGLPISQFIAATNRNDVVPEYLQTAEFKPRPSVSTLSNAMDVGNPSNFPRLLALYNNSHELMKQEIQGIGISDDQCVAQIIRVSTRHQYQIDPHTAVGVAAWERLYDHNPNRSAIILATAHPAKFYDQVKNRADISVEIPAALREVLTKKKVSIKIRARSSELKSYLLD